MFSWGKKFTPFTSEAPKQLREVATLLRTDAAPLLLQLLQSDHAAMNMAQMLDARAQRMETCLDAYNKARGTLPASARGQFGSLSTRCEDTLSKKFESALMHLLHGIVMLHQQEPSDLKQQTIDVLEKIMDAFEPAHENTMQTERTLLGMQQGLAK